jgi:hypothetical protein
MSPPQRTISAAPVSRSADSSRRCSALEREKILDVRVHRIGRLMVKCNASFDKKSRSMRCFLRS